MGPQKIAEQGTVRKSETVVMSSRTGSRAMVWECGHPLSNSQSIKGALVVS